MATRLHKKFPVTFVWTGIWLFLIACAVWPLWLAFIAGVLYSGTVFFK